MNDENFSINEAETHIAKAIHGWSWELLEIEDRTQAESEEILHAAHTGLFHWLHAGRVLNHHL